MKRWGLHQYLLSEAEASGVLRLERPPQQPAVSDVPAWQLADVSPPEAVLATRSGRRLESAVVGELIEIVASVSSVRAAWWVNELGVLAIEMGAASGGLVADDLVRAIADGIWELAGPPDRAEIEAAAHSATVAASPRADERDDFVRNVLRWIYRAAVLPSQPDDDTVRRVAADAHAPFAAGVKRLPERRWPVADVRVLRRAREWVVERRGRLFWHQVASFETQWAASAMRALLARRLRRRREER